MTDEGLENTAENVSYTSLISQFDTEQTKQFMSIIDACHQKISSEDFKNIIKGPFRQLVPHKFAACGIGERGEQVLVDYVLNVDFPEAYLAIVLKRGSSKTLLNSPIAEAWARQPETTYVSEISDVVTDNKQWMQAVQAYDMQNMIVSGLHDLSSTKTSYFCFASCNRDQESWHKYVVDLLTPHLHKALTKLCATEGEYQQAHLELTDRESEVLRFVGNGLTNTQIGKHLFISQNTVKNHVQSIFKKLKVINRVQAVARAHSLQLISDRELDSVN